MSKVACLFGHHDWKIQIPEFERWAGYSVCWNCRLICFHQHGGRLSCYLDKIDGEDTHYFYYSHESGAYTRKVAKTMERYKGAEMHYPEDVNE